MRYKRGDELVLKIEEDFGYSDKTYRQIKVQVIGFNVDADGDEAEYLVYVPPYEHLSNTWTLTARHAEWYGAHRKFVGDSVAFIVARHPVYKHIPAPEGECCDKCGDFVAGAVHPSIDDPYRCRSCKLNPFR